MSDLDKCKHGHWPEDCRHCEKEARLTADLARANARAEAWKKAAEASWLAWQAGYDRFGYVELLEAARALDGEKL